MKSIILIDKNGWVSGVVHTEPFDAKSYPDFTCVEVDFETSKSICEHQNIVWYDGTNFNKIDGAEKIRTALKIKGIKGTGLIREIARHAANKLTFTIQDHPSFIDPSPSDKISSMTLGSDWRWAEGAIEIREYKDTDQATVTSLIKSSWGTNPRGVQALKSFDSWVNKEGATALLVLNGGVLINVQLVRSLPSGVAAQMDVVSLSGIPDEAARLMRKGLAQWKHDVGFTVSSYVIENTLVDKLVQTWKHAKVPDYSGYLTTIPGTTTTEVRLDLKKLLTAHNI